MIYDPIIPIPWILCIALVMLGTAAFYQIRSARRLGPWRYTFLLVLRLAALVGILLLLLQPCREEVLRIPPREKSVLFAVDTSASMKEPHRSGSSRLDAARADLETAGVLDANDGRHRFWTFSDRSAHTSPGALRLAPATGETTRMHASVASLLREAPADPAALFILSDGHDFELVPPGDTARLTRTRDLPIFTIPYGTAESARDVAVRISNYHPHTFVRQRTRLEAMVRTIGCPHDTLAVDLLCDGKKVQSETLDTGAASYHTVRFEVAHEEAGQHEYTFRLAPVANERELSNNTATTYLNVISERIRVLEIEGAPFWDTTFLRRSFARNDKFDIDSLVAFTGDRVRPIRANPERAVGELKPPATVDDLKPYDLVIFGREVERVIGEAGIRAVETWVKSHGGVLVFARGKAWEGGIAADLEPVDWVTGGARGARLEVTPQAGSVAAFRLLREVAAEDLFPEVIVYPTAGKPKTLASSFAVSGDQAPAVVYRRCGDGQTLSLGVGNLWRWVFNPKADYDNNAYDRFWDQLTLWLLANGGVTPVAGYSLRADTSNLPLGETIRLRFAVHGIEPPATPPSIELFRDDAPVTTLSFPAGGDPMAYLTEFVPRATGRYRAQVKTPDAKLVTTQFIVFREDTETTETAMDRDYLEQLAKATGGRMLDPSEIAGMVESLLRDSGEQAPLTRRVPLWDRIWVLLLLVFLLTLEWHNRRRWGLT
ncbi:MAG: hypothetical protein K9N23_09135 [Akkermansiaceae bacterium]|nr:hypothetical protein [Akkermansiaceae bacterium]